MNKKDKRIIAVKEEAEEITPVEEVEETPVNDITKVVFTFKNKATREFCPEFHGKDFIKVADGFAKTKAMLIEKREDK